jgi:hypothetical protein
MDFYCTNPEGQRFKFQPSSSSITFPRLVDKLEPREMDMEISRNASRTVRQFAEIVAVDMGIPIFRGYVESYKIDSKKTKSLTIKGMEYLLNQRYCPGYFWPAGSTSFASMFADTLTDLVSPGLIAMANATMPPDASYEIYNAAENIIKLPRWGTTSRLMTSSLYGIDYRYARKLDEAAALIDLVPLDNSFWRDGTDLYVKLKNHYHRGWYDVGGLLAENAFDTSVRLGTISQPSKVITGSLETNFDQIGDLIVDLALGHGFYVHIRDSMNNTYIDINETEGVD